MVRVTNYFDTQIRLPVSAEKTPQFHNATGSTAATANALQTTLREPPAKSAMTNEQLISWYAKIFEGVKLRYRKLLRLAR